MIVKIVDPEMGFMPAISLDGMNTPSLMALYKIIGSPNEEFGVPIADYEGEVVDEKMKGVFPLQPFGGEHDYRSVDWWWVEAYDSVIKGDYVSFVGYEEETEYRLWKAPSGFEIELEGGITEDNAVEYCITIYSSLKSTDPDERHSHKAISITREIIKIWKDDILPFLKEKEIEVVFCYPTSINRSRIYKRFGFIDEYSDSSKMRLDIHFG